MNLNMKRFWKGKKSVTITEYDPTYKVIYLGNVLTAWAKGDGCVDKPLSTLWRNYCQSGKADVSMKVTVVNSGLKAVTKEHGLTEYWANRITFCLAHPNYPRLFCWIYRHEGKKLKQELRCHAVLCSKHEQAVAMAEKLHAKLAQALQEFRREKMSRQNARLSLANSVYDNPSLPRRKILLSTGTANYRPPLERSKSAPKLFSIEEEDSSYLPSNIKNNNIENELSTNFRRKASLLDDFIDEAIEEEDEDEIEPDEEEPQTRINNDVDDIVNESPAGQTSSSSSTSSSPTTKTKNTSENGGSDDDGDNISDESGYSEETRETCKM